MIDRVKDIMPELPYAKYHRYMKDFGLSSYEAEIMD